MICTSNNGANHQPRIKIFREGTIYSLHSGFIYSVIFEAFYSGLADSFSFAGKGGTNHFSSEAQQR